MPDYRSLEQQFSETLGLERRPVAVKFQKTPPAGVPNFTGTEPSGCSFWRLAASGRTFYTVPGDHYNYAIGSYTHNIPLPEERAEELDQTLSFMTGIGYIKMEEIPQIPRLPQTPGVVLYAPLGDTPVDPDVVLFAGRPERIVLLQEPALRAGLGAQVPLLGRPTCMALPAALAHRHAHSVVHTIDPGRSLRDTKPSPARHTSAMYSESSDHQAAGLDVKRGTKKRDRWTTPDLRGKVAVVTGASRGAGRGIACVLGECGATVYVTGRSVRGSPTTDQMPGTIEDTAGEVSRRGGYGIPVQCDHTLDEQVRTLFERIGREQSRLDLLVNNAWGGYESPGIPVVPFWKTPLRLWDTMFVAGLKAHLMACYFAIPLMLPHRRGLIISTVAWDHDKYLNRPDHPNWGVGTFYDIAKHAIVRMIYGLGIELRPYKIAAVAVAPGFMRTERVLQFFKADEQTRKNVAGLKRTETPEYVGRAVAALAADRRVLRRSGCAFHAGELAREYGFTDVDGRQVRPFTVPGSYSRYARSVVSRQ